METGGLMAGQRDAGTEPDVVGTGRQPAAAKDRPRTGDTRLERYSSFINCLIMPAAS